MDYDGNQFGTGSQNLNISSNRKLEDSRLSNKSQSDPPETGMRKYQDFFKSEDLEKEEQGFRQKGHKLTMSPRRKQKTADLNDFIEKEVKMEDLQLSNNLFNQVKVADFVSFYFSLTTIGLSIVARERDYLLMTESLETDSQVFTLQTAAMVINFLLISSINLRYRL